MARNLVAALQTFRVQQALLALLGAAGPATTRELIGYCGYRLPSVTQTKLQRLLTHLRKARALQVYPIGRSEVLWALPGQPKPHTLPVRHRTTTGRPPMSERRSRPRESWWLLPVTRDQFRQALEARWAS